MREAAGEDCVPSLSASWGQSVFVCFPFSFDCSIAEGEIDVTTRVPGELALISSKGCVAAKLLVLMISS